MCYAKHEDKVSSHTPVYYSIAHTETDRFRHKIEAILKSIVDINIQCVQLKSGPHFNVSNLFTKIYNMLYYTTNLYLQ